MEYNVTFFYDPLDEVDEEKVSQLYDRFGLQGENVNMLRDNDEKGRDILQKEADKYRTGERKVIGPIAYANFKRMSHQQTLDLVGIIMQEFRIRGIDITNSH